MSMHRSAIWSTSLLSYNVGCLLLLHMDPLPAAEEEGHCLILGAMLHAANEHSTR